MPKCGPVGAIRDSKKFCKISILDCCTGAGVSIVWLRPPVDSLTSRPITASRCGGGRSKAVPRSTPRICERHWEHHPRTFIAEWPEVVAGGVDSKTPPPIRINSREATARPIHRHPTLAGIPRGCRSSQYDRRYTRIRGKHSRPKAAGMRAPFGQDDETPPRGTCWNPLRRGNALAVGMRHGAPTAGYVRGIRSRHKRKRSGRMAPPDAPQKP
jgi:hypothetical protein